MADSCCYQTINFVPKLSLSSLVLLIVRVLVLLQVLDEVLQQAPVLHLQVKELLYKKEEEDITTTWPRADMARRGRASRASMLEVPLMGPWDLKSPSIGTLGVPLQVPARSALYTCRVPRAAAAIKEIDRYEAACFALELRLECKDDFLVGMFVNYTKIPRRKMDGK